MAAPMTPQPMPKRAWERQGSGALRALGAGRRWASGARRTPQRMPRRAWERQESGALRPLAAGRRWLSGTRQSAKARLEVTLARMGHLPWMSEVAYPGVAPA